jgi:ABC-2 type transport system ATP-binding protein
MATGEEVGTDTAGDGEVAADTRTFPDGESAPAAETDSHDAPGHGDVDSGSAPGAADAPGTTAAVTVSGLSKRFGSGPDAVTAVDDVSVEIETGSVVGLLGPNGAGKTTLIKSVLGMVLPDEGSVRIHGIDMRERPREAYAHVDAMLEGARNDYWRLTVRENLRYFAAIGGIDPDSVADRHDRLLDRLGLTEKVDTPVRNLSRGMKQKVSLASTLASGADVVFLDEPTLGLDVESSRTLRGELRRLVEDRGLTVVLSSHDMDVIEAVCDRVLIMSDGRIIADDSVAALLSDDDRHRFRVTSPDFDPSLRSELGSTFEVVGSEQLAGGTRVEFLADTDDLYALMARLREEGVVIDDFAPVDPGLEETFVELTGRTDADGERG